MCVCTKWTLKWFFFPSLLKVLSLTRRHHLASVQRIILQWKKYSITSAQVRGRCYSFCHNRAIRYDYLNFQELLNEWLSIFYMSNHSNTILQCSSSHACAAEKIESWSCMQLDDSSLHKLVILTLANLQQLQTKSLHKNQFFCIQDEKDQIGMLRHSWHYWSFVAGSVENTELLLWEFMFSIGRRRTHLVISSW